jgi:DNA-binding FadR family transcriptional regulator
MESKKKAANTDAAADFTFEEVPSQGRLHGSLARRLAIDILNGTYKPGDILPFQIDSSEALNISRTPYREALKILSAKGLIESKPKRGTLVCERSRWNLLDPEVMGWMFETTPSNEFMDGLFELRLINEPAAAAERRSEEEVVRLKNALDIMGRETLATETGRLADLEFHKVLLLATRNEVLISLNSSIAAAIAWTTRLKSTDPADARNSWPDHARVFEAVAAKNARDARWAMESLVRFAREDTTRSQMRRMS